MNLKIKPVYWGILIFILAQAITFGVIIREDAYFEEHNITIPVQPDEVIFWPTTTTSTTTGTISNTTTTTVTTTISNSVITATATQTQVTEIVTNIVSKPPLFSSLGPILIYFFTAIILISILLFIIPLSALKLVFRAIFAFLFGWAIFIVLVFWLPLIPTIIIAVGIGILWFFVPKIWLHNLIMILTMVSLGAVFGRLISPWTAMIILLVIALYDFLAVRFGFMTWMAKKMEASDSLPAFIIPYDIKEWKNNLRSRITDGSAAVQLPEQNKHSILGGGDIGFPLLLTSAVYFAVGFNSALLVSVFSLAGLITAYLIQSYILKGKPMPALPPIAFVSLIGLLLVI